MKSSRWVLSVVRCSTLQKRAKQPAGCCPAAGRLRCWRSAVLQPGPVLCPPPQLQQYNHRRQAPQAQHQTWLQMAFLLLLLAAGGHGAGEAGVQHLHGGAQLQGGRLLSGSSCLHPGSVAMCSLMGPGVCVCVCVMRWQLLIADWIATLSPPQVNHLSEGVKLGLRDDREKRSEALGRWVACAAGRVGTIETELRLGSGEQITAGRSHTFYPSKHVSHANFLPFNPQERDVPRRQIGRAHV